MRQGMRLAVLGGVQADPKPHFRSHNLATSGLPLLFYIEVLPCIQENMLIALLFKNQETKVNPSKRTSESDLQPSAIQQYWRSHALKFRCFDWHLFWRASVGLCDSSEAHTLNFSMNPTWLSSLLQGQTTVRAFSLWSCFCQNLHTWSLSSGLIPTPSSLRLAKSISFTCAMCGDIRHQLLTSSKALPDTSELGKTSDSSALAPC